MRVRKWMRSGLWMLVGGLSMMAGAAEFQPIGSRAISMGGAGVASAQGPFAVYFNPAQLARADYRTQVVLGGGIAYREINLVQVISDLNDVDIDETFDALAANALSGQPVAEALRQDLALIDSSIRLVARDNGFQFMPTASFGVQVGRFGVGAFLIGEATAHGVIDETRLDLIVEQGGRYFEFDLATGTYGETSQAAYEARSLQHAIDTQRTYVQLTGVTYTEIPLAYAHPFMTHYGELAFGAAIKAMLGTAFDLRIDVDTDEFNDEWSNAQHDSTAFGLDAGLLFAPDATPGLTLGLAAKNLNTPRFKVKDGDDLSVKPQLRAGVAYAPLRSVELAMDLDVTRNDTFLPDFQSQFLGGGISYHPRDWVSLRAGLMVNLAESDDGVIFTGGLGLGSRRFQFDISGQVSTESSEYEDTRIPRTARVQLALVSKWL